MNLITIIPIARAIGKETLTYFSSEKPPVGSIVSIPLRNKKISGIVVSVGRAELQKSEIKNLPYGIKKMESIKAKKFLLPEFVESAQVIADYYATTTGSVLSVLIPKAILESNNVTDDLGQDPPKTTIETSVRGDVVAVQASIDERYSTYRSTIREEFAKRQSVFLCLPSREEIKIAKDSLHKGIEQYTFVLHNGLTTKDIVAVWKKILETEHPVFIIATGYFFCIPRADIHTVIIENESSRGYTQPARPFLDFRMVAELLAKKMHWRVVFGDTALRVETIWREKENQIAALTPLKYRVLSRADCILSDMRTPKEQSKKEFEIIGTALVNMIIEAKENNDNVFLFCSRKGLSPLTVCADCGDTVSCNVCEAPVVLYGRKNVQGQDVNIFICQKCGTKQPSDVLCKRCNSWKLTTLGIGIETVEKEIKKKFPDSEVFIMDKDHVKTYLQAEKLAQKFMETPGSILLGTEMAIPYIKQNIGYAGVVSLDSFFSIPDWRIIEKIMNVILALRGIAERTVIVQTRRPDEVVFDYGLKGNLADFYHEEIAERKKYGYPPFHTFIKISLEGPKIEVRAKMEELKADLATLSVENSNEKQYDLSIFEAFHPGAGRKYVVHGLLMLPYGVWPDVVLTQKLRSLSPQFTIKIDPDSLL